MELFKISDGPWERIFSGNFLEHEVDIYSNPDKILLTLIYEKKLDRIEGAIVELYKVFYANGEVESFTETLPREVIVLTKHDEKSNLRLFLLGSKPSYVRWVEDEFLNEVDSLIKRLTTSSAMIKDISKAYDLTLKEISECDDEIKRAFFTQTLMPLTLISSSHAGGSVGVEQTVFSMKTEVVLGLTKEKKQVHEPLSVFSSTIVNEGLEKDRARVMQIIGESALLSNVPVVFFDFNGMFSGLGDASKDNNELQKYEVDIDPIGFPVRAMKAKDAVKIDLNIISYDCIAELLGIGDKDFARVMKKALSFGRVASVKELVERIVSIKASDEFTEFEVFKTARTLKLLDAMYPNLFSGPIDTEDISKPGSANIARASLIDLKGVDEKVALMLIYSTIKSIRNYFAAKGESKAMRIFIILPNALIIKSDDRKKLIAKEISDMLYDMPSKGAAYVLGSQHALDIDMGIRNNAEAKVDIVFGNDAGVQLKNAKSYRVLVRPTLSTMP